MWTAISPSENTKPPDLLKLVVIPNLDKNKPAKVLVNSTRTDCTRVDETGSGNVHCCCFCERKFAKFDNLYEHKVTEHNLRAVYRCIHWECMEVFESVDAYRVHHDTLHSQLSFVCQSCNLHVQSAAALHVHKLHSHPSTKTADYIEEALTPELCETVFMRSVTLCTLPQNRRQL